MCTFLWHRWPYHRRSYERRGQLCKFMQNWRENVARPDKIHLALRRRLGVDLESVLHPLASHGLEYFGLLWSWGRWSKVSFMNYFGSWKILTLSAFCHRADNG